MALAWINGIAEALEVSTAIAAINSEILIKCAPPGRFRFLADGDG